MAITFQASMKLKYVVCTHWNRTNKAIVISTHNIPFKAEIMQSA